MQGKLMSGDCELGSKLVLDRSLDLEMVFTVKHRGSKRRSSGSKRGQVELSRQPLCRRVGTLQV